MKSLHVCYTALFIPGIFWGGILPPPKKNLQFPPPQVAAKLCALYLFFGQDSELQILHGNFLLVDDKHRKLFAIKQPKGCKFMLKMHLNTFGQDPLRGSLCFPLAPLLHWGPTSQGREARGEREGEGPTSKGDRRGDGKGGEGNSPPQKKSI